ncbi:autotransporter outer membrane beta-barrel domain-containing protein [Variovorax sp. J22R133]|uniref:autotransporter family protein n=1 Tax=Variovorax brevis TaxID=3053503 RepID=UPI0025774B81|nr:autotransporter outer membrane beta-barrel domain-containing protein [Variovorax sp. J22R133]MDM0113132.1 autotransporter outer membrane beta-barrel domain-containing protein [Variovorax sp. J22R133]
MASSARLAARMAIAAAMGSGCAAFAQCAPAGCTPFNPFTRPETGALLGNQRLSGVLFVHGLDDRSGEPQWPAPQGPDGARSRGQAWLRASGEGASSTSGSGHFDVDTKGWLLQGGADLATWSLFSTDRLHLGAIASVGGGRTDATALGNPVQAHGDTSGVGTGFYGTWFQNERTRLGWYTDLWWQYGWFDNKVDSAGLARMDYRSHVAMASAEAGYALPLMQGSSWVISPQAQIVYVHNHTYNFIESDGTEIDNAHRGGWMSRLGVRVMQTDSQQAGVGLRIRPYGALNWWYDAYLGDEVLLNQNSTRDLWPSNRIELKGGVAVDFGRRWAGWADLGWQRGNQSYQAWAGRIGARYNW